MGALKQRFCSVENQQGGEPLVGKGGTFQPHLLLTWPRRKWDDHVFAAKDMPERVAARLEALRKQGWRVQLIDRRGHNHAERRLLAPMSGHEYAASDTELPNLLEALLAGEAEAANWHCGHTARRLLLCCTHGKIDRCCAKFGNAAYQALCTENADRGFGFDVWESSHVGGCRLAANVVSLPALHRYGRVTPESVPALLEAEAAGRPYLPCFRGRAGLNPLAQCADLAARQWLAERGLEAELAVDAVEAPETPCTVAVTVRWQAEPQAGALTVRCRSRELTGYGNCGDMAIGEVNTILSWWAESVAHVPAGKASPCV